MSKYKATLTIHKHNTMIEDRQRIQVCQFIWKTTVQPQNITVHPPNITIPPHPTATIYQDAWTGNGGLHQRYMYISCSSEGTCVASLALL